MKKLFLLLLALLMVVSLFACGETPADTTTEPPESTPETTVPPETTSTPESSAEDLLFTAVNETVYVYGTGTLNIRESYSADSKKVGEMKEGEQVTRTGYNEEWSRILYKDGKICYASSKYLTTAAPMEFEDKSDTLYIGVDSQKIYLKPSVNADALPDYLGYGAEVTRTGVSKTADESGKSWSKLLYNGTVCYVPSDVLIAKTNLATGVTFTPVNEKVRVTAEVSLSLREDTSLTSLVITTAANGAELIRTGIATAPDADGITWSRILYEGKVCYASSSWLSNEKLAADGMSFKEVKETVYVTAETSLNLRADATLDSSIVAQPAHGVALERTGIMETEIDGVIWSRIVYNGRVCYASSAYLSTTAPTPPAAE